MLNYISTPVGNRNSLVSILNRLWARDTQLLSRQRQKVQTLFGVDQCSYSMDPGRFFHGDKLAGA